MRIAPLTVYESVAKGTLIDGLWDGHVEWSVTKRSNGETFDLSFSAVKGVPTDDKTEEYLDKVTWQVPGEGWYYYAYDHHDAYEYMAATAKKGELLGIYGMWFT